MYVDYSYYTGTFGGKMQENEFPTYERVSETCLRSITYMNGDIFSRESEAVKMAVCAIADVFHGENQKQGRNSGCGQIKSENNDGYSVTYVTEQTDGQTSEELARKKAYEAAYMYLLPTGWLSRRVRGYADECGHYTL